jgi:hypothetical protein
MNMKNSAFLLVPLLFLTACGREEIATCQVPKESSAPTQVSTMGSSAEIEAVQASHAAMSASAPSGAGYESSLPAGWAEIPGSGMRKASYKIQGTSIDFYLISLSMGDVPSNVNRWRGQVGLPPVSPEAIAQDVVAFQADGHAVSYIEIYNEEGGQGIIAAIIELKPQYWYFTAKGSAGELKAHAADIRAFLESIQFESHNHE